MPFNRATIKKYTRSVLRWCIPMAALVLTLYWPVRDIYNIGGLSAVLEACGIFVCLVAVVACVCFIIWWVYCND